MRRLALVLLIIGAALLTGCATNRSSSASKPAARAASTNPNPTVGNYRDLSAMGGPTDSDSTPGSRPLSAPFAGGPLSLDRQSAAARAQRNAGNSRTADSGSAEQAQASGDNNPPVADTSGLILGEGDEIQFRMSGQPDLTTTSYVSREGTVSLPLLGRIKIGGQSPSQAETTVADAYQSGGYFNNPQVNITITQYRSSQISVLGAVNKPGRYPLETRTSVLDALALAGGVTTAGSSSVVVIRNTRQGTKRYRLQVQHLVSGTGGEGRFNLASGDTLFVPKAPLFYIYGEVRRPDAYPLQPGMTVMQAISTGGGLTERGSNSRVVVNRKEDGRIRKLEPELTDRIQPGDVIFVKERFF